MATTREALKQAQKYLSTLPPHVREREGAQIIQNLIAAIDAKEAKPAPDGVKLMCARLRNMELATCGEAASMLESIAALSASIAKPAPEERESFEAQLPSYFSKSKHQDEEGDWLYDGELEQGMWIGWQMAHAVPRAPVELSEPISDSALPYQAFGAPGLCKPEKSPRVRVSEAIRNKEMADPDYKAGMDAARQRLQDFRLAQPASGAVDEKKAFLEWAGNFCDEHGMAPSPMNAWVARAALSAVNQVNAAQEEEVKAWVNTPQATYHLQSNAAQPDDLPSAIERGTKAWAGTPAGLVDDLRGGEEDAGLLDWLDENIFHREMDDWDKERMPTMNMWVMFAPKGVQGAARNIIRAAIAAQPAKQQENGGVA